MHINSISIQNFRSINLLNLEFDTPISVICGHNNAGKTTILEALYFCSNLSSFKPVPNQELILESSKFFKISLNFTQNQLKSNISIEKSLKTAKCLYNNKKILKKRLMITFPCYSLVFGFNNILLNDSSYRRDFLDSGMFHVEHDTQKHYLSFVKSLKQRNFLLKAKKNDDIKFWTEELINANEILHHSRNRYFDLLNKEFVGILDSLRHDMPEIYDEISSIKLVYNKGWEGSYKEQLDLGLSKDTALGFTSIGTHRADIKIKSRGKLVKESGSMSTLVLSCLIMYLAKIKTFHVKHGFKPLLLIDDLFFGIDNKNLETVIKLLIYSNSNIVMTAPNIYREILEEVCKANKKISIVDVGAK